MLEGLVGSFLDSLGEKAFQRLLVALLQAESYGHVHLVHGLSELGRDVVAVNRSGRSVAIQAKVGDIGGEAFRAVRGQLEEILTTKPVHPDEAVPETVVLATTGRLVGSALPAGSGYADSIRTRFGRKFLVWDRDDLARRVVEHGNALREGAAQPAFLTCVAAIDRKTITRLQIDEVAKVWRTSEGWGAALDAMVLSTLLEEQSRPDLAAYVGSHLLRVALTQEQVTDEARAERLAVARGLIKYFADVAWEMRSESWFDARTFAENYGRGAIGYATYPVLTMTLAEMLSLRGLLLPSGSLERVEAELFLSRFISSQPGAAHPIGDRWCSAILPIAAVLQTADPAGLERYLTELTRWTADRYDNRPGLAPEEASPELEVATYLIAAIPGTNFQRRPECATANVVVDVAGITHHWAARAGALNEFQAVGIKPYLTIPPAKAFGDGGAVTRRYLTGWPTNVELLYPSHETETAASWWDLLAIGRTFTRRSFTTAIARSVSEPPPAFEAAA